LLADATVPVETGELVGIGVSESGVSVGGDVSVADIVSVG
jgi:hypothetical protein